MVHEVHRAILAAGSGRHDGNVAQVVAFNVQSQAFERGWIRFDRHEPARGDLWRGPQGEHADVAADVDQRIVRAQLEPRILILPLLENLPSQELGGGPHRLRREIAYFAIRKPYRHPVLHEARIPMSCCNRAPLE